MSNKLIIDKLNICVKYYNICVLNIVIVIPILKDPDCDLYIYLSFYIGNELVNNIIMNYNIVLKYINIFEINYE